MCVPMNRHLLMALNVQQISDFKSSLTLLFFNPWTCLFNKCNYSKELLAFHNCYLWVSGKSDKLDEFSYFYF